MQESTFVGKFKKKMRRRLSAIAREIQHLLWFFLKRPLSFID